MQLKACLTASNSQSPFVFRWGYKTRKKCSIDWINLNTQNQRLHVGSWSGSCFSLFLKNCHLLNCLFWFFMFVCFVWLFVNISVHFFIIIFYYYYYYYYCSSFFNLFGIVHSIANKGSSKHVSHSRFDFFIITNKGQGKTDIIFTNLTR